MNKRCFVSLLLCLLVLPMASNAQTYVSIGEMNKQPPARWTQNYETPWRTVEIDVQPTVPDVDSAPILKVMQDLWLPNVTDLGDKWKSEVDKKIGIFYADLDDINTKGYPGTKSRFFFPPYDFNVAYGEFSDLTLGDVVQQFQSAIKRLGSSPDHWQYECPYQFRIMSSIDKKTQTPLHPDIYLLEINQKLEGIPVLCSVSDGFSTRKDNELALQKPFIFYAISTPDVLRFFGSNIKAVGVLAQDIPLCDFSIVKEALEEEIQSGHIRKIFNVDFGYSLYNKPGTNAATCDFESTEFYAVPVWRVECYYVESGKKEMRDYSGLDVPERGVIEYKTLIVNAQNGEVLDCSTTQDDRCDYQGFLSWEDVGGRP